MRTVRPGLSEDDHIRQNTQQRKLTIHKSGPLLPPWAHTNGTGGNQFLNLCRNAREKNKFPVLCDARTAGVVQCLGERHRHLQLR